VHDVNVEMNSNKAPPFLLTFIREYKGARRFGGDTPTHVTMECWSEKMNGGGGKREPVVTVQVELWI